MKRLLVIFLCIMAIQGVAQKPWNVKNIEDALGKEYYIPWTTQDEYKDLEGNALILDNGEYKKKKKIENPSIFLCDTYVVSGLLKIGKKEYVRFVNSKVDFCLPLSYCQENLCFRIISKEYWDNEYRSYPEKYAYVDDSKFRIGNDDYWVLSKIVEDNNDETKIGNNRYRPIQWEKFRYEFGTDDSPIYIYTRENDYLLESEKRLSYPELQEISKCKAVISKSTFDSLVAVQNAKLEKERIEKERKDSIKNEYAKVRKKCEKIISSKYPYGVARITDFEQNSVRGIEPTIEWRCYDPNIKIKYIEFTIRAYNKVDDVVHCSSPSSNASYRFAVGESSYYEGTGECTYYSENVYKVALQSCKVQTYDGKWHKIPININIEDELLSTVQKQSDDPKR